MKPFAVIFFLAFVALAVADPIDAVTGALGESLGAAGSLLSNVPVLGPISPAIGSLFSWTLSPVTFLFSIIYSILAWILSPLTFLL